MGGNEQQLTGPDFAAGIEASMPSAAASARSTYPRCSLTDGSGVMNASRQPARGA